MDPILTRAGFVPPGGPADASPQLAYHRLGGPRTRTRLGADGRARVGDITASPWRMVCHLDIEGPFSSAVGTGWLAGPRTVVTAGHCVFDKEALGGKAVRITVTPGLQGGEAGPLGAFEARRFVTTDEWQHHRAADFDIGAIHLEPRPGQPDPGDALGWFGIGVLPDPALRGAMVNVSGYPLDKPERDADHPKGSEQWHARNRVTAVTPDRLFYEVDTIAGQSGGPVYVVERPGAAPLVVGIHAYGIEATPGGLDPANSAPRITVLTMAMIESWIEQA